MKNYLRLIPDILMIGCLILIFVSFVQEIILSNKVIKMDDCISVNGEYFCKVEE